jgi:AcrR family transcriptional regulator
MMEQRSPRTRTRLAPDVRRASILDAATRLILRAGTPGLTMADIAHEAGVARGTLYLYFDSVDGMTVALRDRYIRALTGDLEPLLAIGGSGGRLSRLDAFIAALATALRDRRDLHHALFSGTTGGEAALTGAFRALLRRFLQDGSDTGEFTVPDVDLTTDFLLAGVHAVLTRGLHKPGSAAGAVTTAQKLARRTLSTG